MSYHPLFLQPFKILSSSKGSHIVTAQDISLVFTRKGIQITVIPQMTSRDQQIIGNTNSFNSFNSLNLISTANFISESDEEGRQILQWLSPLEPQQRHQGVRSDRLNSVGNWVQETSEFRKWCDAEGGSVEPVLFCYGNPGVGKTYVR